jgi:hypothetical protein
MRSIGVPGDAPNEEAGRLCKMARLAESSPACFAPEAGARRAFASTKNGRVRLPVATGGIPEIPRCATICRMIAARVERTKTYLARPTWIVSEWLIEPSGIRSVGAVSVPVAS